MRAWPLLLVLSIGCKVRDPPPVTARWTDSFDRAKPGRDYLRTGPGFTVEYGALRASAAHAHPLWLRKKLPHDVRIEFDTWGTGDIEIDVFGDGKSFAPDPARTTSTGYELIFSGPSSARSVIARLDERGKDVVQRALPKVEASRHYHCKIERSGTTLTWWIEGGIDDMQLPFLVMNDPHPLEGTGHEYFGFDGGPADTWFDNLVITPL